MNLTAVESSTLATIAPTAEIASCCKLEFNCRTVYHYLGVPAVVREELLGHTIAS
jgi:hypothetical protein